MVHTTPTFWRFNSNRYRLVGMKCVKCGSISFPPKKCLCGGKNESFELSGTGKILSYTIIRAAPRGFEAPYAIGIIKLVEGPTITGQIVNEFSDIDIDKDVSVVFRKLKEMQDGLNVYGFKFEIKK
jgi:uncharacterized protein